MFSTLNAGVTVTATAATTAVTATTPVAITVTGKIIATALARVSLAHCWHQRCCVHCGQNYSVASRRNNITHRYARHCSASIDYLHWRRPTGVKVAL